MDLVNCRIIDVVCGTGFFVTYIVARGPILHGIDIGEQSIADLRRPLISSSPGSRSCTIG